MNHLDTNLTKLNPKLFFLRKNNKKFINFDDVFDFKQFYEHLINKNKQCFPLQGCDNFDCIFKSLKKEANKEYNFLLNKDLLDFRLNIFNNLADQSKNITHNLNINQIRAIYEFSKSKPFKILECDKNVGAALISNERHDKLVFDNLSNLSVYKELNHNPLDITIKQIKLQLTSLYEHKHINKNLFDKLISIDHCKLGSFRLLPKLHKNKFSCRPIINCKLHPTSLLSKIIELILQPLVKQSFSYIKDSQEILIKTQNLYIPEDSILYAADFESLYTNINTKKLIDIVCDVTAPLLTFSKFLNPFAFRIMLTLVLNNNIFKYKDSFFIQISGIVMGTICGPTLANIFVFQLEKHWYSLNTPIFYVRCIDDIFLISNDAIDLNNFEQQFDGLKSSNQPEIMFNNIPKSLFIRIRRICSSFHDYQYFSRILISQLCKRGFCFKSVNKCAKIFGNLNRNTLLDYKTKIVDDSKNITFFNCYYDNSFPDLKHTIKSSWNDFTNKKENHLFKITDLYLTYSLQQNLKSTLIFNKKPPAKYNFRTSVCNVKNCSTCKYVLEYSHIVLKNNFKIPIKNNNNCNNTNVVYFIFCMKCKFFYIGQTSRIGHTRIAEHIRDIKNFKLYNNKITDTAIHFNNKDHSLEEHFRFLFYVQEDDDIKRKSIEADLINISKSLNANLMNSYIPPLTYTKNLSFR